MNKSDALSQILAEAIGKVSKGEISLKELKVINQSAGRLLKRCDNGTTIDDLDHADNNFSESEKLLLDMIGKKISYSNTFIK